MPTALVINIDADKIEPPLRLRMSPRLIGQTRPFPIMSMQVHQNIKGVDFKQPFDRLHMDCICTLLVAFSEKLWPVDDFAPMLAKLERGPFISSSTGYPLDHVSRSVDEIAPSILDTAMLRRCFPSLLLNLPKDVSIRLAFNDISQPLLRLSGKGVSLKIELLGGVGGPAWDTAWKRRFAQQKDCSIQGVAFRLTLSFGGLGLLKVRRKPAAPAWSIESTLNWFQNVFDWVATYLDWLDSDDEIPVEELFELVEEYPPHYKYSKGSLPPGNGHIVFDMD